MKSNSLEFLEERIGFASAAHEAFKRYLRECQKIVDQMTADIHTIDEF